MKNANRIQLIKGICISSLPSPSGVERLNIKKLIVLIFVCFNFINFNQAQQPQGFFLNDWQPKTIVSPGFIITPQTNASATVAMNVDFASKINKVSKYVYGNNAIPWAGKMNQKSGLMNNISNLNPHVLRWPGGNNSNAYYWDASEVNLPTDIPSPQSLSATNLGRSTANWVMTLDDYYDELAKTNSTGCICVNYAYARKGTSANPVANAAHYAANWVRYDKGRTKYWEIGNENYGNWEPGYTINTSLNKDGQPAKISGALYGKHCGVFIDSMRYAASQIGSSIKIGVVAMDKLVTWDTVQTNWNAGMMPQIAGKADFLAIHYYFGSTTDTVVSTILNTALTTASLKNYVLRDLKTYGKIDSLPVALTEWNINVEGYKQEVSYINGMHAAIVLGEQIKNQFGESTRWDLINGWANGDDHGMFASSSETDVPFGTPHAPFYYMYYFQKYFGDQMVSSAVSNTSDIAAYASSFSSGQCGIVVVNKGSTVQTVDLRLSNFPNAKSYYRYVLTGGTDNGNFSRKVYVNGNGPTINAGGPDNYASLPALGTSVNGDIKFDCPALSVTYLLVTSDIINSINDITDECSVNIYPNPTQGEITIESADFNFNQIEIFDMTGKKVFTQQTAIPIGQPLDLKLNIAKGLYFIRLSGDRKQAIKKIIVF